MQILRPTKTLHLRRLKAEGVWTTAEALCMKREALLDCLETMQERHKVPWARTSIDIAIEVAPPYSLFVV